MPSAHAYLSLGILLGLTPQVGPEAELKMLPPCGEANELKLGFLTGFFLPNQCGALSIPRHTWSRKGSLQVTRAESRGAFGPGLLRPRFHVTNPLPRLSPTVAWKPLPPSERWMVAKARFPYRVVSSSSNASD